MQQSAVRLVAVVAAAILLVAGGFTLAELRSMDARLGSVASRLDALEQMNRKLSVTNQLLLSTNARLETMIAASASANRKLGAMQIDLATMSHKLSGSFLFRGVK